MFWLTKPATKINLLRIYSDHKYINHERYPMENPYSDILMHFVKKKFSWMFAFWHLILCISQQNEWQEKLRIEAYIILKIIGTNDRRLNHKYNK